MPNYCSNALLWEGDNEQVAAFEARLSQIDDGLLSAFYPMHAELLTTTTVWSGGKTYLALRSDDPLALPDPATYEELTPEKELERIEQYDAIDWYDWSVKHWGTKWDVPSHKVEQVAAHHLVFDTAWAPPEKWLLKVSQDYPLVRFTLAFCEGGNCFWGTVVISNGEVISEDGGDTMWQQASDEDWDTHDPQELLLPEVREHTDKYHLGLGG